jgi:hypothetical protein
MPVAMRLHSGRDIELAQPEAAALEAAGIVVDGDLHPVADSILATMTDPDLVATVECTTIERRPRLGTVWGRGATGVVGESPAPDTFTLHQTQRGLLPFHVMNLVGVGPRPTPSVDSAVVVDTAVLAASRPHWHTPEVVSDLLTGQDIPQRAADALAAAHAMRRASWRVTCLRTDATGAPQDGEALVLDGDDAGYWSLAADADAPGTVTFTPLPWPFVIDLLGTLLPAG